MNYLYQMSIITFVNFLLIFTREVGRARKKIIFGLSELFNFRLSSKNLNFLLADQFSYFEYLIIKVSMKKTAEVRMGRTRY
jgi:hypothetical protein